MRRKLLALSLFLVVGIAGFVAWQDGPANTPQNPDADTTKSAGNSHHKSTDEQGSVPTAGSMTTVASSSEGNDLLPRPAA